MIAFAEHEFRLSQRDKKGTTLRETLEGLLKRASRAADRAEYEAELTGPVRPDALDYLWAWFLELHAARGGGMGPSPITFPDMLAWSRLRGIRPAPWEVDILTALDRAWLAAEQRKEGA